MQQTLLEGARNCLTYLGVKPGEEVLLLPTFEFLAKDPDTVEALRQACAEMDAHVSVTPIEALGTRGEPNDPVAEAVKRADLFIGMGEAQPNPITGHCQAALSARWDMGGRQVDLRGGRAVLATQCSLFPSEIIMAIARHLERHLEGGGTMTLTDDRGSNFSFDFDGAEVFFGGSFASDTFGDGQRCDWPLGQIMIHIKPGAAGVAMVDSMARPPRPLAKPARFTVTDSHVAMEQRDDIADIIVKMAEPQNSDVASKLFLGLNPKGSFVEGEKRSGFGNLTQAAGCVLLGIHDIAGYISSTFNTGGYLYAPTISVNGKVISKAGRFSALDDPEVRATASKYGDPDMLLTQLA